MTRILVVDDMAVFREPIAAALAGFETKTACDGIEALAILKQRKAAAPPLSGGRRLLRRGRRRVGRW